MKLTDHTDAHLVRYGKDGGLGKVPDGLVGHADGVLFKDPLGDGMILCWFKNRPNVPDTAEPVARWQASGLTIENLSLHPSVDVPGGWHGWVANGEAK